MNGQPAHVYVQTNARDQNEIAAFARSSDGALLPAGRFRTDGSARASS